MMTTDTSSAAIRHRASTASHLLLLKVLLVISIIISECIMVYHRWTIYHVLVVEMSYYKL